MMLLALLLCAALGLQARCCGYSSGGGSQRTYSYTHSGPSLTDLYNSRVRMAEKVSRPFDGKSSSKWPFNHSGVRVTLEDDSQWLIHKGDKFGRSSQTVVTDARDMSNLWTVDQTKDFKGSKTVSDFVRVGGENYNVLFDNCHMAAGRMMSQDDEPGSP